MLVYRLLILFIVIVLTGCKVESSKKEVHGKIIKVVVSIPPQKFFVEKIGADRVKVYVIVKPGQNPATYDPAPLQMAQISESIIFFRIGVPFEFAWLDKIISLNKNLKVVDTRKGIKLKEIQSSKDLEKILTKKIHPEKNKKIHKNKSHDHRGMDPHIWMNPKLVEIQAKNIMDALLIADPENTSNYMKNYRSFIKELNDLDLEIKESLKKLKNRKLLVFHPSWGYFAEQYSLIQIPIEIEGKEPGQKDLQHILEFIKEEGIKTIFIQKQFSTRSLMVLSKAINGKIIEIDPLAEDYITNMKLISEKILSRER